MKTTNPPCHLRHDLSQKRQTKLSYQFIKIYCAVPEKMINCIFIYLVAITRNDHRFAVSIVETPFFMCSIENPRHELSEQFSFQFIYFIFFYMVKA